MFKFSFFKSIPYKHEIAGICLIALTVFLTISLFSYSSSDASWFFYRAQQQPIHNLAGIVGAHCAALLYFLWGSSAILLIGLSLWLGSLLFFYKTIAGSWDRLLALSVSIIVCAMLCNAYGVDFIATTTPGGFIGLKLYGLLVSLCGVFGSLLVLHTLLLVCLIIIIRFSCMSIVQYVLKKVHSFRYRNYIIQPLYKGLKKGAYVCVLPAQWLMGTAKQLYSNTIITDEYNVVDFEKALIESADTIRTETACTIKQEKDLAVSKLQTVSMISEKQHNEDEKNKNILHAVDIEYQLPNKELFVITDTAHNDVKLHKELEARAKILEEKLERFGIFGKVTSIKRGPVVTLFEYEPNIDTKVSKILALEDDLALALQAMSIRIMAPIPGKSVVGFEVANKQRKDVLFSHVMHSDQFENSTATLPLILGQDTGGNAVSIDLVKMPHLLVAGSTGSGKSVALNAMLISLLCKCKPDMLKLILIDPKRLEFACYSDIPHLLFPIITETKKAAPALRFVVQHMEERYALMAKHGARTIADYNALVGVHEMVHQALPYIVVVIDELSDLMMTAGREVEDLIARIAQMARAAGIHMIVATQRPSVDVITGLIKVNFPSRISFRVTSKIDSRTILDVGGADKLLGRGDMLFLDANSSLLKRIHGAYVSDKEINHIVNHVRSQQKPNYLDLNEVNIDIRSPYEDIDDHIYTDVLEYLKEVDEVSISLLQRRFRIGFNRSARIIEQLQAQGRIINSEDGRTRKVVR